MIDEIQQALVLHQQGNFEAACTRYRALLKVNPERVDLNTLLATALMQQGDYTSAQQQFEKTLQLAPDNIDCLVNFASLLQQTNQHQEAIDCLQRALALEPQLVQAWNNLGNLQQLLKNDAAAIASYQKALELQPNFAQAWYNKSLCHTQLNQLPAATAACLRCTSLMPDFPQAWGQLIQLAQRQDDQLNAFKYAEAAIKLHPANDELLCLLGSLKEDSGELTAALTSYLAAYRNNPRNTTALSQLIYIQRSLCQWHNLDTYSKKLARRVRAGDMDVRPFTYLTEPSSAQQQKQCAINWSQHWPELPSASESNSHKKSALNSTASSTAQHVIGYVSADFYRHPTSYLAVELFEQHDRSRFRVIGYSNAPDDGSKIRQRVVNAFDQFVEIGALSLQQTIARIKADKVDILVDLKGHTLDATTGIFASHAAPVQVNYLGYPGTMGANYIDYIIGDRWVTPADRAHDFSETIVQLPGSYQVNDRHRVLPEPLSRKAAELPENTLVLGCFNNNWKITPTTFARWMAILKQLPDAILWLMEREPKQPFADNIRQQALYHAVDPGRIYFARPKAYAEYLRYYTQMDLLLDTFPYNAHTMASDALWMGCPVVTLSGDTFASRVGASLLDAVGLEPELHCHSETDYQNKVLQLANNPPLRANLRKHLITHRSSCALFDSEKTTRAIETSYLEMIQRKQQHQSGRIIAL